MILYLFTLCQIHDRAREIRHFSCPGFAGKTRHAQARTLNDWGPRKAYQERPPLVLDPLERYRWYNSTVLSAVFLHENFCACFRPLSIRETRSAWSVITRMTDSAISCELFGSTKSAASPATSGIAEQLEATRGSPDFIASINGSPIPS